MGVADIIADKAEEVLRIAGRHGVSEIRLFGSVARGDATQISDVDFLVGSGPDTPPWYPGGLIADLEKLLGREVNIVEMDALTPRVRSHVLSEAVSL